ncbi:actin- protein 3 [Maublancomyces gigas]|uniref:Actin- protein 3 n=1 Tax=Discina gigas TaxID=1032678 RepID=A0ABR3GHV5_9PEZI
MLEVLLDRGAAANNPKYWKILLTAVGGGHTAVVRLLLGNAPYFGDVDYETILDLAAGGGHLAVIELLLDDRPDIAVSRYADPLTAATKGGHITVVKLLLDRIPDICLVKIPKALRAAAGGGSIAIVKLLLRHNLRHNEARGSKALQAAAGGGYMAIVKLLLDCDAVIDMGDCQEALLAAAKSGCIDIVSLLFTRGVNIPTPPSVNHSGTTPLEDAILGIDIAIVKLFLSKAAMPMNNESLWGSLEAAVESGQTNILKLLLSYPVEAEHEISQAGSMALHIAADRGYIDMVGLLLLAGAHVNHPTVSGAGSTASSRAIAGEHSDIVTLLLAVGADMNTLTHQQSALCLAVLQAHTDLVNILLENKADVHTVTIEIGDPNDVVHSPAKYNDLEITQLLFQYEARLADIINSSSNDIKEVFATARKTILPPKSTTAPGLSDEKINLC